MRESDDGRRSSLFTTIRASQIFQNNAPPLPVGNPIAFPPAPYLELLGESNGEYKVQVTEDYEAGLEDEFSCSVGDIIIVKEEYDDGKI